jgi:hypothetical protein
MALADYASVGNSSTAIQELFSGRSNSNNWQKTRRDQTGLLLDGSYTTKATSMNIGNRIGFCWNHELVF